MLQYLLTKGDKALMFHITQQSQEVYDFLSQYNFEAKNRILIKIDNRPGHGFPEWKESQTTLYLRGGKTQRDLNIDITPFGSNKVRNERFDQITAALKEFIDYLKAHQRTYYVAAPVVNACPYNVATPVNACGYVNTFAVNTYVPTGNVHVPKVVTL